MNRDYLKHLGFTQTAITMRNTQLPAEIIDKLKNDAVFETDKENERVIGVIKDYGRRISYLDGYQTGYIAGATAYALKLNEAQQEIESLKGWKSEASTLLDPILKYGQSKEANTPLGESITNMVLERCKRHDQAQEIIKEAEDFIKGVVAFIGKNEKSTYLLTEIKTFLDGTK